jgi:hypothetical protein
MTYPSPLSDFRHGSRRALRILAPVPQQIEGQITVGRVDISMTAALDWVREYTDIDRNITSTDPYAFPAYDRFQQDENDPLRLSDADLLAPTLLNVPVKIRTFYGLQRVRRELEAALAHPNLVHPLAEVDDRASVHAMVEPLYSVLDGDAPPVGALGTTLSKILHRKRPQSIVLHDQWVRACYIGDDAPVPTARTREWADYMALVTYAIGEDIRAQPDQFAQLDAAASTPGELSAVRLLDILAWRSQGAPAGDPVPSSD